MEEQKEREALKALIAGVMPGRENALVFGEGPQNPKLMLIGEAPGEQESLQGRPFVGKAGKNLDHFLELGGEGHIALGADLDGCDRLPAGFSGLDDYEALGDFLKNTGYSDETIQNLFCNSLMKVVKTCIM